MSAGPELDGVLGKREPGLDSSNCGNEGQGEPSGEGGGGWLGALEGS